MEGVVRGAVAASGAMTSVRAAFGLLTRLPVGTVADVPGAAAFALVGAVVGLLAAVPLVLLILAGEPVLGAIAAVAVMALVSGGLHLDGLADTADALIAPHPAAAEQARDDPAVGPGGAATLLLLLGAQVAAIASLAASSSPIAAGAGVVIAGAVSRWLPVLAVALLRSQVGPEGLGAWFSERVSRGDAILGAVTVALIVAVAAVVGGWAMLPAALIGTVVGIVGTAMVARARGRLDGDGLGASVEIALTATVVGLAVIVP